MIRKGDITMKERYIYCLELAERNGEQRRKEYRFSTREEVSLAFRNLKEKFAEGLIDRHAVLSEGVRVIDITTHRQLKDGEQRDSTPMPSEEWARFDESVIDEIFKAAKQYSLKQTV